jgi:tetratricopeptide (TPR) repeat protein
VAAREWIERSAWELRSPEFGSLSYERGEVCMGFANHADSPITVAPMLEELWRTVPPHPRMLEMLGPFRLKYAALDWEASRSQSSPDERWLAAVGVFLVRTFQFLQRNKGMHQLAWFLCPLIYVDIFGDARFAFGRDSRVVEPTAPEVFDRWPSCEPPAIIFAIGHALRRKMPRKSASALNQVIERCIERDVKHRFQSLQGLESELHRIANKLVLIDPKTRKEQVAFEMLERGRGLLDIDRADLALRAFEGAQSRMPFDRVVNDLIDASRRFLPVLEVPPATPSRAQPTSSPDTWDTVAVRGAELERQRDFGTALLFYRRAEVANDDEQVARFTSIARCYFHRGEHALAVSYAGHALALRPTSPPALRLKCHALIHRDDHDGALIAATDWCVAAPTDADAHYARGKALLHLKRYPEARDAFDVALKHDPKLVEAMLLRRQVDIAMKNVRARVGAPAVMQLDVPDDLPELRAAMIGGKLDDALAILANPELATHTTAQLYRGQILFFLECYEDALAALAPLTSGEARYARARVLTALDRYEAALAELDVIREHHPEIVDAAATRAFVLDALGRPREAEAAELAYLASVRR